MKNIKQLYNALSSLPLMIVSGVFLALGLLNIFTGIFPIDPSWVTIVISGIPLLVSAAQKLAKGRISSALLISIAMIASIFISEVFAAGEVAFIMAIGGWLEDRTVERAKKGIEGILKLVPQMGRRIRQNASGGFVEEMVESRFLEIGDVIRILPGEGIAADGLIVSGTTSVDQSILTGESLPVDKATGDELFTGTINRFGSVDARVTKAFADSSLQRMIALVKQAEESKAPMQKIVDKWAEWLVPLACLIAIIAYFVTVDITRAVTVLVVFCPCALVLATPTSIVAAIGQATKFGVLIKSGEALELMGKIGIAAFDKTGTLTTGKLTVTDAIALNGMQNNALISLAAAAESRSEHPLGKAVLAYAKENAVNIPEVEGFSMTVGKGVRATVNGKLVYCGNEALMQEAATQTSGVDELVSKLRSQGKAVIIVAEGKVVVGVIGLSDTVKPEARDAIEGLHNAGIKKTVLLTGDNAQAAGYIAGITGVKEYKAGLLPEDKVAAIMAIKNDGQNVCMTGDGVNDAPALKMADVGIAMGTMGSDIAIDAADIAIMGDDITKIAYIKRLSNATIKTITFNISMSMAINFAAIILSVLGLLNPITGALVHNVGSVLVVLNAALLYDRKI